MNPFYENKQEGFHCFQSDNLTFPAHLHSAAELVFVQKGSLTVTVQDQTKTLFENEIALIFPDLVHGYVTSCSSSSCLCTFSPGRSKDYYHIFRTQQPASPFFLCGTQNKDIPFAFSRMLSCAKDSPVISEAWLHLILAHLLEEAVLIPRDSRDDTEISYRLISYVSSHFQEPLTLDGIAQELHFNKYYISRVFTRKLHCGFSAYVNRLRLDYAAHELRSTDHTVTEIWQEAGFESQKTFNRAFLSCYGVTPTHYRKTQSLQA